MTQFPYQQSRNFELNYGTDAKLTFNFFNSVYAWMSVGLVVTAISAWFASQSQIPMLVARGGGVMIIAIFLGLAALSFGIQSAAARMGAGVATALFMLYAAVLGAVFSPIVLVYPMQTIAAAFVITAGTFGVMSIVGYVTKINLTRMGGILMMAVIGLFIASMVNVFLMSNAMSWFITYAVVIVFTALVAYQTQMLKEFALANAHNPRMLSSMAIVGALMLYVSFINIFMSILRILGDRR